MIYVIDDNAEMAECIARACRGVDEVVTFADAITAMAEISGGEMPRLIFLDILLTGPDGFTFLNELVSYTDTGEISVVVVSSLDLGGRDLSIYNVVGTLDKEKMTPREIRSYAEKYAV